MNKDEEIIPYPIRLDKQLISDCKRISKQLDSDLSKEIRKLLKGFRIKHKNLLK